MPRIKDFNDHYMIAGKLVGECMVSGYDFARPYELESFTEEGSEKKINPIKSK